MPLIFSETGEFNTLEAVNLGLTYMREPRIDDLALINTSFAAEKAYANLLQQNRVQQMRGWWFNTTKPTLTPDPVTGRIAIPATYSKVELHADERCYFPEGLILSVEIDSDANTRFLKNGETDSLVWTRPIRLEVITIKKFMNTPDQFRRVVALQAASLSGQEVDEAIAATPFHQRELERAESELMDAELSNNKVNIYSTQPQVR
ncbi:hypothetical protein [Rhizobium sp. 18065]|uniref:hypothetical protein n=1 Tax=Rhizobium sp. 18065 TaxID=2681411 RepID=UPI00135B953B|nr:hypothetical protein [Rhizobium sp. 18065]